MPAIRRTAKKATYAVAIMSIMGLLVALLIVPNILNRGIKEPPPPERASILVERVDAVPHGNTVDIVARIRNPNPRAGVPVYTVIFVLIDAEGNELKRIPQNTYLLPGSLNYIAVLEVPTVPALNKVRVETTEEPVFSNVSETVPVPKFNTFLRERTFRTVGTEQFEVQKGVVTNSGTLGYNNVDVTGVALNSEGKVIGVSTTFIGEFRIGEQREFTLQWPAPSTPTERVLVLPATNIYREDNILQVSGDPDRLREAPEEVDETEEPFAPNL